jgi:hypothetical protein
MFVSVLALIETHSMSLTFSLISSTFSSALGTRILFAMMIFFSRFEFLAEFFYLVHEGEVMVPRLVAGRVNDKSCRDVVSV